MCRSMYNQTCKNPTMTTVQFDCIMQYLAAMTAILHAFCGQNKYQCCDLSNKKLEVIISFGSDNYFVVCALVEK